MSSNNYMYKGDGVGRRPCTEGWRGRDLKPFFVFCGTAWVIVRAPPHALSASSLCTLRVVLLGFTTLSPPDPILFYPLVHCSTPLSSFSFWSSSSLRHLLFLLHLSSSRPPTLSASTGGQRVGREGILHRSFWVLVLGRVSKHQCLRWYNIRWSI